MVTMLATHSVTAVIPVDFSSLAGYVYSLPAKLVSKETEANYPVISFTT